MIFPTSDCHLTADEMPFIRSIDKYLQNLDDDKVFTTGEWLNTLPVEELLVVCRAHEYFCTQETNDPDAWQTSQRGEFILLSLTSYSAEMQLRTTDDDGWEVSLSGAEIEQLVKGLAMLATLFVMYRKRVISLSTTQLTITPSLRSWADNSELVVDPEKMLEHFTELNELPECPPFMHAFSQLMFGGIPGKPGMHTFH